MKAIALLLLAFASCCAFADGVPLITPSTTAIAPSPALEELANRREFVKFHQITFNKNAFGGNVLNVTIDGKVYRFAGSMMPAPQLISKEAQQQLGKQPDLRSWSGNEPGGGRLVLTKNMGTGDVVGIIELPPARRLDVTLQRGVAVLVETDRNIVAPSRPPSRAASQAASGAQK